MIRTWRQQASFDEVEEVAELYHQVTLEYTMIMMENGLEVEGIDHMMGLQITRGWGGFQKAVTRFEESMCK